MEKKVNRQNRIKPTSLQYRAVSILLDHKGDISVGQAMRNAGYSIVSAKNPKALTDSRGFKELMEEYLPDNMLLGALSEDIKAKKGNRKAELELAFKIKGKITQKDPDHPVGGNTYNTYIQQNNHNPNAPEARELVQNTLDHLMEQTKWIAPESSNNTE